MDSLLARLRAGPPVDLVVTEVFQDPAVTCGKIRRAAPGVAVAFVTTRARPADIRLSESLGCAHFVKPMGAVELLGHLGGDSGA